MNSAVATPTQTKSAKPTDAHFDPEEYRMSLGDHLEELRHRLILGLGGFFLAAVVCLIFGERVLTVFCAPLVHSLHKYDINPQLVITDVTDGFVVYMQISLICAAVIAGPWLLFQLWAFVRAGLYPKERNTVTKYIPFSIGLLISGMLFLYFFILPISLDFLIGFTAKIPFSLPAAAQIKDEDRPAPTTIPALKGDPKNPRPYEMWLDTEQSRLKVFIPAKAGSKDGLVRVIPFGSQNLLTPMITLPQYIDLVLRWLIIFGLAFQTPLVILGIARVGLVDIPTFKKYRKIVYFGITCLSAVVVPDVVTGMIAMMVPMALLYELGIFLASRALKKAEAQAAAEAAAESTEDGKSD